MRIYLAAPLFSNAERTFNESLTERLERSGFRVFLPQRDGVEKDKPPYDATSPEERREAMFGLDEAEIHEAEVFLFVLDGRIPDEGACVELGIAHSHRTLTGTQKFLVGFHTDTRAAFLGSKLNPMLRVPLDSVAENEEALIETLEDYRADHEAGAISVQSLPDFQFAGGGELASRFRSLGIDDYRAAARHVRDIPYGRNSDRSGCRLVLEEHRGTCSTKHALLAALAREEGAEVELRIGVYLMDGVNTPGVAHVLHRYGLSGFPEAHCYLSHRGERVDMTGVEGEEIEEFLYEETIEPDQIGAYKLNLHRGFLQDWAVKRRLDPEHVWQIREECIGTLSISDG